MRDVVAFVAHGTGHGGHGGRPGERGLGNVHVVPPTPGREFLAAALLDAHADKRPLPPEREYPLGACRAVVFLTPILAVFWAAVAWLVASWL